MVNVAHLDRNPESPVIFHKRRLDIQESTEMKRTIVELDTLQVIIKTAERCNLACQYCYYFFMGDKSFEGRKPIMPQDVYRKIPGFLENAVRSLQIKHVNVAFHGGEPTLQKLKDFDSFCELLHVTLSPLTRLSLTIQTNGLHLPKPWTECLARHNVKLGLSIDGPAEYHDKFRTDNKGRGSYQRIETNVRSLLEDEESAKKLRLASISVMNHSFDISKVNGLC